MPFNDLISGFLGSMYGGKIHQVPYNNFSNYPYNNPLFEQYPYPSKGSIIPKDNLIKRKKCAYCGNIYQAEMVKAHRNCPTCAGGWDE